MSRLVSPSSRSRQNGSCSVGTSIGLSSRGHAAGSDNFCCTVGHSSPKVSLLFPAWFRHYHSAFLASRHAQRFHTQNSCRLQQLFAGDDATSESVSDHYFRGSFSSQQNLFLRTRNWLVTWWVVLSWFLIDYYRCHTFTMTPESLEKSNLVVEKGKVWLESLFIPRVNLP